MTTRIAINGFGRIGRLGLRAIVEQGNPNLQIIAINDLGSVEDNAHMLRYDSVHGRFPGIVGVNGNQIDIGQGPIQVFGDSNPEKLPWGDLDIDVVLECSGHFTARDDAAKHLTAGAKKVLISAPGAGADYTVVYGVNHDGLTSDHKIVSNASCTTNCLAPVAKVINDAVGIERGYMTTIHAYTADQRLVDGFHKDNRRARAAAQSLIPTSTGAAKAVGIVLPELAGKLDGTAIRVPTPNVSLIDFTFTSAQETSIAEINEAILAASKRDLKGVLATTNDPLVSIDFNHTAQSSTFDLTQTQVIDGRFCRVLSWYDNEWGFANRMVDVLILLGQL